MMQSKNNLLNHCASIFHIDVSSVTKCMNSRSVDQILQKYADLTDKVNFKGVPAIAFDNVSIRANNHFQANYNRYQKGL